MTVQNYDYIFAQTAKINTLTTIDVSIIKEDLRPYPKMILVELPQEKFKEA